MLGGPDGRTLFIVAAKRPDVMNPAGPRTGRVLTAAAARLVADLAGKWGVPIPQTLREIASAELIVDPTSQRLNGNSTAPSS